MISNNIAMLFVIIIIKQHHNVSETCSLGKILGQRYIIQYFKSIVSLVSMLDSKVLQQFTLKVSQDFMQRKSR